MASIVRLELIGAGAREGASPDREVASGRDEIRFGDLFGLAHWYLFQSESAHTTPNISFSI